MKMPDLSTHSWSVILLSLFTIVLLIATIIVYRCGTSPTEIRSLLAGAFSSFSGALLLSLKGGSSNPGQ